MTTAHPLFELFAATSYPLTAGIPNSVRLIAYREAQRIIPYGKHDDERIPLPYFIVGQRDEGSLRNRGLLCHSEILLVQIYPSSACRGLVEGLSVILFCSLTGSRLPRADSSPSLLTLDIRLSTFPFPYPLSFQIIAHSFCITKISTLLFSGYFALFSQKHPVWGYSCHSGTRPSPLFHRSPEAPVWA